MPILGFMLVAAGFVVQGESENLISTAKACNRATLAAVDAEIRGAMGTLQALSSTPSLVSGDFEKFHRYAGEVLASQASWQNILLTDRDGRQIVNARLPWGTPLLQQPVEPRSVEAAITTHKPVVGDLNCEHPECALPPDQVVVVSQRRGEGAAVERVDPSEAGTPADSCDRTVGSSRMHKL